MMTGRTLASLHAHDEGLADDGRDERHRPQVDRGPAVQPETEQRGGREREQHGGHHFGDGDGRVGVGGMGDGVHVLFLCTLDSSVIPAQAGIQQK